MATALDNVNPVVRERETVRRKEEGGGGGGGGTSPFATKDALVQQVGQLASDEREPVDAIEVFEHIRDIADPEHPYSLEQLGVVSHQSIKVRNTTSRILILSLARFTSLSLSLSLSLTFAAFVAFAANGTERT